MQVRAFHIDLLTNYPSYRIVLGDLVQAIVSIRKCSLEEI